MEYSQQFDPAWWQFPSCMWEMVGCLIGVSVIDQAEKQGRPVVRRGGVPGSEKWFMVDMIPGIHPLEELEAALLRIAVDPPESLLQQLQEDEQGLARVLEQIMPEDGSELLLMVDQFEDGLVAAIIDDVSEQPGALPLLQYALTELFERRQERLLTKPAYEEIGGVLGALGRRAEELYTELDDEGEEAARQLFMRLVTSAQDHEIRLWDPISVGSYCTACRLNLLVYGSNSAMMESIYTQRGEQGEWVTIF